MSDKLKDNIDSFLGFFEGNIDVLEKADSGNSTQLFKKILYLGLIDALSIKCNVT